MARAVLITTVLALSVALAACDGETAATTTSPWSDPPLWTYFDVEIDTSIVVDLSDGDWAEPPVNGDAFVGDVLQGREDAQLGVTQWNVRFETPPRLSDGRRVPAIWVSVRYVGDELAFLQNPEFTDSLVAVAQDNVGAWRAFLWRSDREP